MVGERIPSPEENPELYDLLILADGPWTETRLRTADARVVLARQWVEYVRLLRDSATADLDSVGEAIDDALRQLTVSTVEQAKNLDRQIIYRARRRLLENRARRAAIRAALLLDEDEPDGLS